MQNEVSGSGSGGEPESTGRRSGRVLDRRAFMGRLLGGGALATAALACPVVGRVSVAEAAERGQPAGTGAMSGLPPCHGAELRGVAFPREARAQQGRFGYMFPQLAAFEPPDELLSALAATMQEPSNTPVAATDNPLIPSGFTFLAQFVDHDLTFDPTPLDDQVADPNATKNFRSARYDLGSVYGQGPVAAPQLYDPGDPDKCAVTRHAGVWDLPRDASGRALIAEPRDDQNLITAQLHLAVRRFHNALVDHVRAQGVSPRAVFNEAQRLTRWHYQWVVLHDLVPRLIGPQLADELSRIQARGMAAPRLSYYRPQNRLQPMMPMEFSAAAYRFGHSMIRPGYQLNDVAGGLFLGEQPAANNLNGSRAIPAHLVIDWHRFFDLPGGPRPLPSRRIDTDLSFPLFRLPSTIIPAPDTRISLAERNLIRGKRLGLPSGQAVAEAMDVPPLSNRQMGLEENSGWADQAPLWFYVLAEADLLHGGERLGPVGGRIVGEVLVGLGRLDQNSYLATAPDFRPSPPIAPAEGVFTMGDLLQFAGAT